MYALTKPIHWLAGLVILLGTFGKPAWATTEIITLMVDANQHRSFETLEQHAAELVQTTTENYFTENLSATMLKVIVSGERNGQVTYVSSTEVSRADWQQHRDLTELTRYFSESIRFLGYRRQSQPTVVATNTEIAQTSTNICWRLDQVSSPDDYAELCGDSRGQSISF